MLNYFNPGILMDTNILIGGEYDLKNRKLIWRNYSKKMNVLQQENKISKILSYGIFGSPFVMIPILNLFSHGDKNSTLIDVFGGKTLFWLSIIILGIIISQSVLYRVYIFIQKGNLCDTEPPIIVQKNILTNDINRRLRHNQANGGIVSLIFEKIPYLQWIVVTPILVAFVFLAYQATNDKDNGMAGHVFFYFILVILVATTIAFIQIMFSMVFIFLKLEKKIDLEIRLLTLEELRAELDKAGQFYKIHKVSGTETKKYLIEYKKILKEKEMELKNEQH